MRQAITIPRERAELYDWLFVALLVLSPLLIFIPVEHPRTSVPAYFAYVVAVRLLVAAPWRVRMFAVFPLLLALYGVVISDDWHRAWFSIPDRRAGSQDWLAWLTLALVLPFAIRDRWRWVLVFVVVVAEGQTMAAIAEPWLVEGLDHGRRFGLSANEGFFGLWAGAGVLAAVYLARQERIFWLLAALCAYGVMLSETRTVMGGVALGMLFLLPIGPWSRAGLGGGMALLGLLYLQLSGALYSRIFAWEEAWEGFIAQPWGHGTYSFVERQLYDLDVAGLFDFPHSLPLQALYEWGLVGLALWVGAIYLGARYLRGPWAALGALWAFYSLTWIPNPAWFMLLAVLGARIVCLAQAREQEWVE